MLKIIFLALISFTLITGCSNYESTAKAKHEQKTITTMEKEENPVTLSTSSQQSASIFASPITFDSTNITISTKVTEKNISEIKYHIWRIADGRLSTKIFSSNDRGNDFSILFDTKEFMSHRGEYQVEAYKVKKDGNQEFLAQTTVTFQQNVPILMYHAVDDYKGVGLKYLFVSPANFEAQMRYLKDNGYTLLTFERWADVNKVNKPIFVTFDDGMENNINAFRILQQLKDDKFQPTATEFMIAGGIDSSPYYLSSTDLKEMASSGIFSVQSHTMSHADLQKVPNVEDELKSSKEKIEQVTGKPVIAIAYPFGSFNDKAVQETIKYYKFAVTTVDRSFIEKGEQNEMFQIQRVHINNNTTLGKFAKLVEPNNSQKIW